MKKFITIILILLSATYVSAETFTVERVVDGDTLRLTNGENVRLIGIDTPESGNNAKTRKDAERTGQDIKTITAMGKRATEIMKRYVKIGTKVDLEFDVQKRDRYNRLLAYVYVDIANDGLRITHRSALVDRANGKERYFLNATMVYEGYAQPMTIPPNVKYAELFKNLYKEARENNRGLWGNNSTNP